MVEISVKWSFRLYIRIDEIQKWNAAIYAVVTSLATTAEGSGFKSLLGSSLFFDGSPVTLGR